MSTKTLYVTSCGVRKYYRITLEGSVVKTSWGYANIGRNETEFCSLTIPSADEIEAARLYANKLRAKRDRGYTEAA